MNKGFPPINPVSMQSESGKKARNVLNSPIHEREEEEDQDSL